MLTTARPIAIHSLRSDTIRLAILGNPDGYYARDLQRAAKELQDSVPVRFSVEVLSYSQLAVESRSGGQQFGASGVKCTHSVNAQPKPPIASLNVAVNATVQPLMKPVASAYGSGEIKSLKSSQSSVDSFDSILVRTMPLGSLEQVIFRMNALHVAERRGVRVINRPRTLEIAIDKWLTLDIASQSNLPIPSTIACQSREASMAAFETLGRNVVVKPLFGGEGRGLIRIDNIDIAHRVFSTLEQIQSVAYIQEFVPHAGFDIRVLFVGDRWYSVARHAVDGDWRTNLSRGGHAEPYLLSDRQLDIAKKAKELIHGDIVGIDILPTLDGRDLLLEVNAVPGWKGIKKACQEDVAKQVIEFAVSESANYSERE